MTARTALEGRLVPDAPLGPLTTYKVGGAARFLVEADSVADVVAAVGLAAEEGLPVFVLGRGSNVLVADSGFAGVVIRPGAGLATRSIDEVTGEVTAGAATPLPLLARETARAGRGGLEFFTGIPGSVGGAVRMNAGCHGSSTAEWLRDVELVVVGEAAPRVREASELDLSYRRSNLTDGDIVVSATFRTEETTIEEAEARIREITAWRRRHQPGGTLNAGSVFKNPPGDAAGRIIDSLGLKGLRVGGAEVSDRHANFFVAHDGATAGDIAALIAEVRKRVRTVTGIDLEPEIRMLGDFP
jgi:UDP-N-acetylmuramate dehydrogenase